jgi:hypothetical protein
MSASNVFVVDCVWHDVRLAMPDDELTVLVALEDGEVWTGYMDAGQWRYVSAEAIEPKVLHWAHFPAPPVPSKSEVPV